MYITYIIQSEKTDQFYIGQTNNFRAFFNYCVEFNLLSHNQLSKISQIRIQEKKLLTFDSSEINLILGNIKHTKLRQIVTIGA